MAQKKQRVFQHVMEEESFQIIKDYLPKEWVVREFNHPDYGVDLVIELFESVNEKVSETLGEYLYVQVKSVLELEIKKEKIYPVGNVTKGNWKEDKSEYIEIDVVKFVLDSDSIYTVQSLGSSISFLLFVVDIKTKCVYFVCLNDFIDKILLPKKPSYADQGSATITIPSLNKLSEKTISRFALEFYGKRAKLLSAFAKFAYQKNELSYLLNYKDYPIITKRDKIDNDSVTEGHIKRQVLYFIEQIEGLDIWNYKAWEVLPEAKKELMDLKKGINEGEDLNSLIQKIIITWHRLTNLGNMYEELAREWFLPKFLSFMTSYPHLPEVIKEEK
ncbi:DUF4365 domain-containing protein [Belliella kenyensis]|uniref:DUF4365 domain-containing protein n=1 Tax=Belliella kenyensis TaxID=1472724 RepID=A0ABV8EPM9_9BACT|nr:DUF4365 domain-containing protein [Belliella kenyensis]MCH7403817.1 DUF4365 domain-containing protein [Belliella kenyensis]MDN3601817.1 DUF4365 domain-containing protein [Belliella kenyensis]